MSTYFVDSSVLLKRHVQEVGSGWFSQILASNDESVIVVAKRSYVEVCSALNRRRRESNISMEMYHSVVLDFHFIWEIEYKVVELTNQIVHGARLLLERHSIRASDAIQLASAKLINGHLLIANEPGLTFVAADERLLQAAVAEQMAIVNPLQQG